MSDRGATLGIDAMFDATTFGERAHVHLQASRSSDGLRVLLWGDQGMQGLEIDFRARPPVQMRALQTDARGTCWWPVPDDVWPLTRGPALWASTCDPFQFASRWSFTEMYPPREASVPSRPRPYRGDPAARKTMRRVYATLADLERTAADLCDQTARRLALRFPFHLRFWVYARLVEDTTGRLAQLATACPGALTFAFGLREATKRGAVDTGEAAGRLLEDVVNGRRLAPALRDAVEAWAQGAAEMAHESERWDPVWSRVADARGAEREALLQHQHLLIRRAGSMVPSTTLFLPPPLAFVAEDIPRAVRANARWFKAVKCARILLATTAGLAPERSAGFSAFVSRNAPALVRVIGFDSPRAIIEGMRDYATATDRWPQRRTSYVGMLEEAGRWHAQVAQARDMEELRQIAPRLAPDLEADPDAPLLEPPVATWTAPDATVVPLVTLASLFDEGRRMQNCVASRVGGIARGRAAIYHATIGGDELTVEIVRAGATWRIGEAKQVANREPTKCQWEVLRRWESQLG